jgi:hypothetical protein
MTHGLPTGDGARPSEALLVFQRKGSAEHFLRETVPREQIDA